jgi:hypothetical protein
LPDNPGGCRTAKPDSHDPVYLLPLAVTAIPRTFAISAKGTSLEMNAGFYAVMSTASSACTRLKTGVSPARTWMDSSGSSSNSMSLVFKSWRMAMVACQQKATLHSDESNRIVGEQVSLPDGHIPRRLRGALQLTCDAKHLSFAESVLGAQKNLPGGIT